MLCDRRYDVLQNGPMPMTLFSSLRRLLAGANVAALPGQALYNAVVEVARRPDWYLSGEVPDTMDGRFDMVALILSLVLLRLEDEPGPENGAAAKQLCADLADRFIVDMDGSLRQEGIGDQVVGKHIGRMMAALGGRLGAYRDARGDDAAMAEALRRNLWRGAPVTDDAVAWVVQEASQLACQLASRPYAALVQGQIA
jgi:cytochrome b pre-mRNA-processing protein 3